MKKYFFDILQSALLTIVFALLLAKFSAAQSVAVNQNGAAAHSSAMFDITSTSKGILIPRLTTNQRTTIPSPATGLLVYDTDINSFMFYNGAAWTFLAPAAAPGGNEWKVLGNAGTDPTIDFLGTTDNQPLIFKTNNSYTGKMDPINKNYFIGHNAGLGNTTGHSNIAVGVAALKNNTIKTNIVAIGDSALYNNVASGTTAVGSKALYSNTNGQNNSAFGFEALKDNSAGFNNSAFGNLALTDNSIGFRNSAFGHAALRSNTEGLNNCAFGDSSLYSNLVGLNNIAVGKSALKISTASNNIAVGVHALLNTTGGQNIAIGTGALEAVTTGFSNTAIGHLATVGSPTIANSTAIGAFAQVNASHSIVLGSITGVNGASSTTKVGIGTTTPAVRLHVQGGTDATLFSNSGIFVVGQIDSTNIVMDNEEINARDNGAIAPLYLQTNGGFLKLGNNLAPNYLLELSTNSAGKPGSNTWTIVSDARLKKDIKEFKDGLAIIKQINPVWFRYNGDAGIKDTTQFVGILAQDIKKIAPYMINENKYKDEKGVQTNYLNYDGNAMTYILINAIKELQQEIEDLKKQVKRD